MGVLVTLADESDRIATLRRGALTRATHNTVRLSVEGSINGQGVFIEGCVVVAEGWRQYPAERDGLCGDVCDH
jgi:hypothetical protein